MIGGKNLLSAIAALIGTAGSGVAILDYFYPHQALLEKPAAADFSSARQTTLTPAPAPAPAPVQEVAVSLPRPAVSVRTTTPPPQTNPEPIPPPPARSPDVVEDDGCVSYTEFEGKRSFSVKTGLEVCDETGRLVASVKKVIVDGFPDYIGVKFSVPGKGDVFCWNEAKSCKIPFVPGSAYFIERLKSTVGGGVATFRIADR